MDFLKIVFGIGVLVSGGLLFMGIVYGIYSIGYNEGFEESYKNFTEDFTCNEPVVNLTCPEPTKEINIKLPYNNIQPTHHDLDYRFRGDDFCVDDIDTYGELSGYSMQPTIFSGNIVIEKEYRGQDLEEGDIIRYKKGDKSILHRIKGDYTDVEGFGYYVTQGDNNKYIDGKVYKSNITHIVVGVLFT